MIVVECVLVVCAVLFYLWFGCFVGREFGSYEKFVLKILENVQQQLSDGESKGTGKRG